MEMKLYIYDRFIQIFIEWEIVCKCWWCGRYCVHNMEKEFRKKNVAEENPFSIT